LALFCTITTETHLFKCYALAESIQSFGGELIVLLVDTNEVKSIDNIPSNIKFNFLDKISFERVLLTKEAYTKDKLRWALKPAYLLYLLLEHQEVMYIDNDVHFFSDFNFLFEELSNSNLLVTPHHYPSSPKNQQTWLEANFRLGLYNAGFIGANKDAKAALEWWSDCCLYEMKRAFWRGLFDDQKYLDLLPVLFDGVKIVKDKGCNFAAWNENQNIKESQVVFIHFNRFTLLKFREEQNAYHAIYKRYEKTLIKYNPTYEFKPNRFDKFKLQNAIYFMKWKIARLFKK
jgi:hypothetical protein